MLNRSFPPAFAQTPVADDSMPTFLRLHEVMHVTGLARSTLYRMMAEHCFPAPCRLGLRAVGWRSDDIAQWSRSRPTARNAAPPVHAGGVR
jgi:prophage regulatory protein